MSRWEIYKNENEDEIDSYTEAVQLDADNGGNDILLPLLSYLLGDFDSEDEDDSSSDYEIRIDNNWDNIYLYLLMLARDMDKIS